MREHILYESVTALPCTVHSGTWASVIQHKFDLFITYIFTWASIYIYIYIYKRYEQNKAEILKYRRERYRTIHKKDLNIKVSTGTFTLYFD